MDIPTIDNNESVIITNDNPDELSKVPGYTDGIIFNEESDSKLLSVYNSLTPRQRRFVCEYLSNGYNATEAAVAIRDSFDDYEVQNDNERCRYRTLASIIFRHPAVQEYIRVYFEEMRMSKEIEMNRIISELNDWAFIQEPDKEQVPLKIKALDLLQKIYYGDRKALSLQDKEGNTITVEYI